MNVHATSGAPPTGGPVDPSVIQDLVYANHICAEQGVLDGYGHVSLRHPGAPDRYFLSRSLSPAVITADDIMEYDLDSNPVDQRGRLMYLERCIHGEIFKARPDVNAIVHSHSPAVVPFSVVTKVKVQPIFHISAFPPQGQPAAVLPHVGLPGRRRAEFRDSRGRRHDRPADPRQSARSRTGRDTG